MHLFTDQLGRTVCLPGIPQRIVSLVPSLTELLFALGVGANVAGITRFCVHPPEGFRTKTRIGGTKQLHLEKIRRLQPDLVIASKEENLQEQVEALSGFAPVWVSNIGNLEQALEAIRSIGAITGTAPAATAMCTTILLAFRHLLPAARLRPTAYLIWQNPYMTAGGDTFIHDMLQRCGLPNLFASQERYPVIQLETLQQKGCELVLLSSEPYPFKTVHAQAIRQQLPGIQVLLADGEYFSWYGSRLLLAPAYFNRLLAQVH